MWNEMKAKWIDKEAKVWFIEQNGSTKMDSTGSLMDSRRNTQLVDFGVERHTLVTRRSHMSSISLLQQFHSFQQQGHTYSR
jgi:hypothetical protein